MNNIDKKYQALLQDIIDNGIEKKDRTGTGTISVFGRQIRHKMSEGFPLLTTKKMAWKTMVTELLWFLRGDTNIKYLVDNGCHIWDGDAWANYKRKMLDKFSDDTTIANYAITNKEDFINKIKTDDEFAKKWGELGSIYGKQWRSWETDESYFEIEGSEIPEMIREKYKRVKYIKPKQIDQIANLISELKTNPDSRRLMVSAWNVGELDQMVLPPCHYSFQVYTRELTDVEHEKLFNSNYESLNKDGLGQFEAMLETDMITPKRAISLMWNQRSVDTFLGLPFNIASYGLLLEIIAKEVNMVTDELIGNLGDVHLYSNHIEQAKEQIGRKLTPEERAELLREAMGEEHYKDAIKELMPFGGGMSEYYDSYEIPKRTREPFKLPKLNIKLHFKNEPSFVPEYWLVEDFELIDYKSHPAIKAPLSN